MGGRLQGLKRKKLFYTIREIGLVSSGLCATSMISRAAPANSGELFHRAIWWYPPRQNLQFSKIEADNEEVTYMERKKATDYPQELLDHFDKYVHGDINRREFLDRANKYAVGGVSAVALWESLKPNYALAQQVPTDDARIKVGYETVSSPQGNGSIKGYFARPAKPAGKLPGVLVIHENRGLNPYIEDVARRLAVANFIAFVLDGLDVSMPTRRRRKGHGAFPESRSGQNV